LLKTGLLNKTGKLFRFKNKLGIISYRENMGSPKGLLAIWITPLRALSQEIQQATERFVTENNIPLTVGIRTGDTTTKERAAQKRNMPNLLITTPESLQLLLASKGYDKTFEKTTAIIIDEWHELLGSKRGVQIELALSRLKTIAKNLRIWGILEEVIPIIKKSKTTLLFTNTRAQCEIWFQKILSAHPEFAGEIAMHHGSINKETRLWVEQAIRNESLKAVVCTSSLDLGVDFAPVETIVQIGGPKLKLLP